MTLKISCISNRPYEGATTDPIPPLSRVPPTTTAAMAINSQPLPVSVLTEPGLAGEPDASQAGGQAGQNVGRHLRSGCLHTE